MKKRHVLALCIVLVSGTMGGILAQERLGSIIDSTIVIERDARLDSLLMRHIRLNKESESFEGYRVQLFSGSGTDARLKANNLRADFMARNPKIPAYLIYQAPNFKVRVGDCRSELEAIRLQRHLAYQYPGGFVARDEVKFPILDIEKERDEENPLEPGEYVPKD